MIYLSVAVFFFVLGNAASCDSCPSGMQRIVDCSYGETCLNYSCVCTSDSPPNEMCCPPYCGGSRCSSQCSNQTTGCPDGATNATESSVQTTSALQTTISTTVLATTASSTTTTTTSVSTPATTNTPTTVQSTLPSTTSNQQTCGISNPIVPPTPAPPLIASLIVNGNFAYKGQFPWSALIEIRDSADSLEGWCSGTVIAENWILTAAHCVLNSSCQVADAKNMWVLVGQVDKDENRSDFRQGNVTIVHPNYDCNNRSNDLALIQLQQSAPFSNAVNALCMLGIVDSPQPADNTTCYVTGWGGSGALAPPSISTRLRSGTMQTTTAGCAQDEICAFPIHGNVCMGDDGGPLFCPIGGVYWLYGVTKNPDLNCGMQGSMGHFTPVQPSWQWINDVTCQNIHN